MIYLFIFDHEHEYPIGIMCKVLEVSRSGYYHWKRSPYNKRQQAKADLKRVITEVYFDFKQRYGNPRLTIELNARGYKAAKPTAAKYLRELGLRSKIAQRYRVTTDSDHNYLVVDNILDREFTQTREILGVRYYLYRCKIMVYLSNYNNRFIRQKGDWIEPK